MSENNNTNQTPKIKLGLFTYSCCEDNTIMITVLMNDYLIEWKKRIDFVEGRVLRKKKSNNGLDVAFVEGAIVAKEQEEKIKKLRERTKILVAIGSCACTGMPAGMRNNFNEEANKEIEFIKNRFQYTDKVKRVEDVVKVDAKVPGCPMNTKLFLKTLNKVFVDFGHEPVELLEEHK